MKRLLERHPDGTQVWFYAPGDGTYQVYTITDVDTVIDRNKKLQNDPTYSSRGIKRGMWHFASIPNVILEHWHNQGIIDLRYPLSPTKENKLHRMRRRFLEAARRYDEIREMDHRQEMAERNRKAIMRKLNDPDYRHMKTVTGKV